MKSIIKTAYSYVRLSSKRQIKGTGEQRQLAKPVEICKQKGWTLSIKTFSDLGVSGWKGKNRLKGDLATFIELAKEKKLGEFPVLIIEQFDRFSRQDIDESEPAILDLLKTGVDIHVAFTNKTFTKESTKDLASRIEILLSLKAAFDYSENLSKRIKSANVTLKSKINAGEVMKQRNTPNYYSFDTDKKQYVQNDKSKIVKHIIKEFISGKTMFSICRALNEKHINTIGYHPKSEWQIMSIKNILNNEALYGKLYDNLSFYSEPIINKSTFDKIQMLLSKSKHNKGRHSEFINIFRGLAKCPNCGESFSTNADFINRRTGKPHKTPYRYMRCSGIAHGTKCKNKHAYNLHTIEEEFFAIFLKKDPNELFASKITNNNEIASVEIEISTISKKIISLIKLDVNLPEIQDEIKDLEKQKNALLTKKQELTYKNLEQVENESLIVNFKKLYADLIAGENVKEFEAGIDTLNERLKEPETRLKLRTMLPSIISKIELDTVRYEWRVYDLTGKMIYESMPND